MRDVKESGEISVLLVVDHRFKGCDLDGIGKMGDGFLCLLTLIPKLPYSPFLNYIYFFDRRVEKIK